MRGRALGFVAILCATWVTARIGFALIADGDRQVARHRKASAGAIAQPVTYIKQDRPLSHAAAKTRSAANQTTDRVFATVPISLESIAVGPNRKIYAIWGNASDWIPDEKAPRNVSSEAIASPLADPEKKGGSIRPIQIYAYSFWRPGDTAQGVLGNGQDGGSQSALLMTIPLLRHKRKRSVSRFSLVGRASVSHDDLRDREWAAGLLWRPSAAFPAQLSLERRFRPDRPDAVAAFVSGGHDGASLPLGFALDGYGQAGFVTGKTGGGFADAQLHILKNIASDGHAKLAVGAGAWAGGQNDIMRVDIGPSARANLKAGAMSLRLDASWRFRIVGNARPGDGPAVTLSTSF
jgi:hypothetical protein